MMNRKRQAIMINLLMMIFTIMILVAVLPMLNSILDVAQASDSLNCDGYNDTTDPSKSYNSSLATNTIACVALDLYVPYIVLAILIGSVASLLRRRPEVEYGGY